MQYRAQPQDGALNEALDMSSVERHTTDSNSTMDAAK